MPTLRNTLLILTLPAIAACGQEAPSPAKPEAPAPQVESASPSSVASAPSPDNLSLYRARCASCHGPQGQGSAVFPKLAGQPAETLAAKLRDYRAGKTVGKQSTVMFPIAKPLSDTEIGALAETLSKLSPG